ncbi:class I SAM-dependent methyltransferase [Nocardia sp. NPDC023852]|uniref:class I SAM-dependent methyltransferase n=1 Tax=Nocardia sp. NPDC023852 TaxID=3154697 RepID=UPI0033C3321C
MTPPNGPIPAGSTLACFVSWTSSPLFGKPRERSRDHRPLNTVPSAAGWWLHLDDTRGVRPRSWPGPRDRRPASEYTSTTPLQVRIDTHAHGSEHPDDPVHAVLDALELTGSEALADIGCGHGRFLAQLTEHGHRRRLVGDDNSTAMVAAADGALGVEGTLGNAEALPLADGEFDRTTDHGRPYAHPSSCWKGPGKSIVPGVGPSIRRCLRGKNFTDLRNVGGLLSHPPRHLSRILG